MENTYGKVHQSQHILYESKYTTARMNLLLVVAFTAINLILLVTNADVYFLFSASVPYYITGMGMLLCGRFPAEYYTGELAGMSFLDNSVFYLLLAISCILTLLYLLAWFLSSKHRVGWLIFALVFFSIDTAGMLLIEDITFASIFDILFHGWVIYYLCLGIRAHYKRINLPPEEKITVPCENPSPETECSAEASEPDGE